MNTNFDLVLYLHTTTIPTAVINADLMSQTTWSVVNNKLLLRKHCTFKEIMSKTLVTCHMAVCAQNVYRQVLAPA